VEKISRFDATIGLGKHSFWKEKPKPKEIGKRDKRMKKLTKVLFYCLQSLDEIGF